MAPGPKMSYLFIMKALSHPPIHPRPALLCFHLMLALACGNSLWEQTNRVSFMFEAESVASAPGGITTNSESPHAWNYWTADPNGKWSGGVVLQSPKVLNDRKSPDEGAPPLKVSLPQLPPGTYNLKIKGARSLAFSTDQTNWVNLAQQWFLVKSLTHPGGNLVFYIDDLFANPGTSGWSYFDAVMAEPKAATPMLPQRPKSAGPAKDLAPGDITNESATYRDPISGRTVRRLTSTRDWNHLPTFHNDGTFTTDSRFVVFTSWPGDRHTSYLIKAEVETGNLSVLDALMDPTNQGRYNGNNTAVNSAGGWALAFTYTDLLAVNLETREKRVLYHTGRGGPILGHPAASIDGKTCYIALRSNLPGSPQGYALLAIDMATGATRALMGEADYDNMHVQPNPKHPHLLLIVRDIAMGNQTHKDFLTENRAYILNTQSLRKTPIRPADPSTGMLTHTIWNNTGDALYYEVGLPGDRHEVGRLDLSGRNTWHHIFSSRGLAVHVGAHTQKDWMVLESENLFAAPRDFRFLKFDQAFTGGEPPMEIICLHGSDMAAHGNRQEAHGHPVVSPDGRFMSFGSMRGGLSDPHVVTLSLENKFL